MSKLISQNDNGIIHVESDDGVIFGIVSQTEILDADFNKIDGDTLTVLDLAGFELKQDWDNESTYIEFKEENGECPKLVFCGGNAFIS